MGEENGEAGAEVLQLRRFHVDLKQWNHRACNASGAASCKYGSSRPGGRGKRAVANCQKLLVELSNFLDDELDYLLRQELEFHLKTCPECCMIVDTTRKTIEIFRESLPYPMPKDVKARLAAALRRKLAKRSSLF